METLALLEWGFDGLLMLILLWLAWLTLFSRDLFRGIVAFIGFGLLMALAWVRLNAVDVALAEAAIGAGLTGALLLAALARLEVNHKDDWPGYLSRIGQGLLMVLIAAGLGYMLMSLSPVTSGLAGPVAMHLDSSGVSNPVTAVLLNFRAYDTLLEVMVLLLALFAVWSLDTQQVADSVEPGSVLDLLTRLLAPLLILVSGYLLWVGAHAPGGAFQAGSVLAGAAVLLMLSGWRPNAGLTGLPLRITLLLGPLVFVIMAVATWQLGDGLLQYPPQWAGSLILILESLATLSIGITLAALFLSARPGWDSQS